MFDWFWDFLYLISKTIFRLIDGLIGCANKLCGITPISFYGEDKDFLSYLLFSDEVGFAFRVSAVLATILLVIFAVFAIIRSITKEKAEGTPLQIAVKAFKTLVTFLFVPAVVTAFIIIGNSFVQALYGATIQSASSPGAFLFAAFAEDGGMSAESVGLFLNGTLDYRNTDLIWEYMDLSDYSFIFSWLAGGVVLFSIGSSMIIFVDRVISIVILYIAAPFSISTSMIDEGARFKLWRDQFLTKFIMGYGMIIAINIYALVCRLVMDPSLQFFEDGFLNLIMKLLLIGGGALTMQKSMALIGNLVSQGAGSSELRDNAFSAGKLASLAAGGAGMALGALGTVTGAKALKSIVSDAAAMKSRDLGSKLLNAVGLGIGGNTSDENGVKDPGGSSNSQNNDKANYGENQNAAKDAIGGAGFKTSDWGNDSQNDNRPAGRGNDMVNDAIGGENGPNDNKKGGDNE